MPAGFRIGFVDPTVFFVRGSAGELRRVLTVGLDNSGDPEEATLFTRADGEETARRLGRIDRGVTSREVTIRDTGGTVELGVEIRSASGRRDGRILSVPPERHWECHLVHGSHHDIGYTDIPSNVLREHASHLDKVMDYCEETAGWPEDSRFHYSVEQAWSVLVHLESRPPVARERMIGLMRSGSVELTALFANETSELCGHEELVRLLYPAFRLARRHGIPVRTAELNDIPGVSWGLASVLSGAGIRYFAPGLPDYFAWGITVRPIWDEAEVLPRDLPGAFMWEGPDRGRVLFWYGGSGIASLDLWTLEQASRDLPAYLANLERRGYPHDLVRLKVHGGHRDNSPPDLRFSRIAREWNERWAFPRLVVSTNGGFFDRFSRSAGAGLRVLRGDLPATDYPIGATSRARELGVNRGTHETLSQAEKLASWAGAEGVLAYPADALAEACEAVLVGDEHTGGMAHPVGPAHEACWSWKSERVWRAAALAHDALVKSANRLADMVHLSGDGYHIVVWNTLGNERTDLVRVGGYPPEPAGSPMYLREAPGGLGHAVLVSGRAVGRSLVTLPAELLEKPFRLVDVAAGESVPFQIVTLADPLAARPYAAELTSLGNTDGHSVEALNFGRAHLLELVFVARNVPSMGCRTYRIEPASRFAPCGPELEVTDRSLENRFYRVELDLERGVVASIVDKESGREWVDRSAKHGMHQLLSRSPRVEDASAASCASVTRGESGPVLASLLSRGEADGCPRLQQEVTLYAGLKRIDFATRVLRDATPLLEHYIAFPFALRSPRFRYESSNAVIEPIRDQLPGTNTDAATVQHWVSAADDEGAVLWTSLDAPVVELGALAPSPVSQAHHAVTPPGFGRAWRRDPGERRVGHLYSFVMDNNFRTNFQACQVGDILFRYAITTMAGDPRPELASAFGWGAATPMEPVCVKGPRPGSLGPSESFCEVEGEGALLLAVKAAEDGDGLVVRLADVRGRDAVARVHFPRLRIERASLASLVEEDLEELGHDGRRIEVPLRANGSTTVRVRHGIRYPAASRLTWLG